MKKLFLFFITIFVMGCTNANTTNSTNKATTPTTARSRENIIYESVIATILYNNADYINSKIHTSKTKNTYKIKN